MASQFVYNLSSLVKILTPSVLTRTRTESKITKFLASLDSKAYEGFASRLRLYHRVCAPFSIAPLSDTAPSTYERLGTYPPHYGSIKESTGCIIKTLIPISILQGSFNNRSVAVSAKYGGESI